MLVQTECVWIGALGLLQTLLCLNVHSQSFIWKSNCPPFSHYACTDMNSVFLVGFFATNSLTVLISAWVQEILLCTVIFLASFTVTILYRVCHWYLITDWWLPHTFLWPQPLSELSLGLADCIIDYSAIIYVPHPEPTIWLHGKLLCCSHCSLFLFILVLHVPYSFFHCPLSSDPVQGPIVSRFISWFHFFFFGPSNSSFDSSPDWFHDGILSLKISSQL